jgi:histone-lysine N-methyltransferase SETD2
VLEQIVFTHFIANFRDEFIMEYVGDVLDPRMFRKRAKKFAKDDARHFYFMALTTDLYIDASFRGNTSRFINHSCEPNAETQKWTVNGEVRVGFFSKRIIPRGEEITFDYKYERYGQQAQKCFCGTTSCRGWLGGDPDESRGASEEDEGKNDIGTLISWPILFMCYE